eukprot:363330-Chlamydomonas_euryale.AAC.23
MTATLPPAMAAQYSPAALRGLVCALRIRVWRAGASGDGVDRRPNAPTPGGAQGELRPSCVAATGTLPHV